MLRLTPKVVSCGDTRSSVNDSAHNVVSCISLGGIDKSDNVIRANVRQVLLSLVARLRLRLMLCKSMSTS